MDGRILFVSGIDLEVRTKVARELGWRPDPELFEQIHDGDASVRSDWPLRWCGLEPLERRNSIGGCGMRQYSRSMAAIELALRCLKSYFSSLSKVIGSLPSRR